MAAVALQGGVEAVVTVGVDTHADVHVAVALDQTGGKLGVISVPTTPAGYRQLLEWARDLGAVSRFGLEGTSARQLVRGPRGALQLRPQPL